MHKVVGFLLVRASHWAPNTLSVPLLLPPILGTCKSSSSIDEKTCFLRASFKDNSRQCPKHLETITHGTASLRKPFRPPSAILALVPSQPKPMSFVSQSSTPMYSTASCTQLKRPWPVPLLRCLIVRRNHECVPFHCSNRGQSEERETVPLHCCQYQCFHLPANWRTYNGKRLSPLTFVGHEQWTPQR